MDTTNTSSSGGTTTGGKATLVSIFRYFTDMLFDLASRSVYVPLLGDLRVVEIMIILCQFILVYMKYKQLRKSQELIQRVEDVLRRNEELSNMRTKEAYELKQDTRESQMMKDFRVKTLEFAKESCEPISAEEPEPIQKTEELVLLVEESDKLLKEYDISITKQQVSVPKMTISQLYIYPIKSIRGCSLPSATLTKDGFSYDRKFLLLKVHDEHSPPGRYKNMHVSHWPSMVLFHTSIKGSTLYVTYHAPGSSRALDEEYPTLEIELSPSTFSNLQQVRVDMHKSATTAYDMGPKYNKWFTKYFDFEVILAYAGNNRRLVLGNLPGKPATDGPTISTPTMKLLQSLPIINSIFPKQDDEKIAFNDCAPYLVITEASCADVSSRLSHGTEMDITKFRANIIITGSPTAFDEDYWGKLSFGTEQDKEIILTANCGRCVSLDVDYEKGTCAPKGEGVLRLLMKDRRVDEGMKYNPIFGRYGFVGNGDEGKVLSVGDEVRVSERNKERTKFYWPGLST